MISVRRIGLVPGVIGLVVIALAIAAAFMLLGQTQASAKSECKGLPSHSDLKAALSVAQADANGGFGLHMWATVVDRDGVVCNVAFTGGDRGDQWPGSRVISAQKANTANAFSLPGLAISTANLFTAVQPGGSLFGLQESNPVDTGVGYGGNSDKIGTKSDPMVEKKIGGVNVFGGGLALYDADGIIIGALGVSGDSSCADHNIAWKTRDGLSLDFVPAGLSPGIGVTTDDNIIYDIGGTPGHPTSASGWGHPACSTEATDIAEGLAKDPLSPGDPGTHPIGPNP